MDTSSRLLVCSWKRKGRNDSTSSGVRALSSVNSASTESRRHVVDMNWFDCVWRETERKTFLCVPFFIVQMWRVELRVILLNKKIIYKPEARNFFFWSTLALFGLVNYGDMKKFQRMKCQKKVCPNSYQPYHCVWKALVYVIDFILCWNNKV